MRWPGTILREAGILSMNQRNADFIMLNNARRLYPLVDDKLKTKEITVHPKCMLENSDRSAKVHDVSINNRPDIVL